MNARRRTDNVGNELIARETNEWISATSQSFGVSDEPATYVCECSAPHCRSKVSLPPAAYELVRADGRQFVICANHENPELDCVIWQSPGFSIIQMLPGPSSRAARDSDPRLDGGHQN